MERNQAIVVVVVLGAFVVAIAATIYVSQSSTGIGSQRFRAAPGAQRDNAEPMFSKRKDRDEERSGTVRVDPSRFDGDDDEGGTGSETDAAADDDATGSSGEMQEEPFASEEVPAEEPRTESERLAQEALFALSPEEGLQRLAEGAAALESTAAATAIYTAAAKLYMQTDPPNTTAAEEALRAAGHAAETPEDEGRFMLAQATLLLDQGQKEDALLYLRGMAQAKEMTSAQDVEAMLLLGTLEMEKAGDPAAARDVLERAWEEAGKLLDEGAPGMEGVYRQATMRLTQVLRRAGQSGRAEEVTSAMRKRLGR